jgi:hypothetical protein
MLIPSAALLRSVTRRDGRRCANGGLLDGESLPVSQDDREKIAYRNAENLFSLALP